MEDLTTKTVMSVYTTVESRLPELAVEDGQLIFIRDKQTIALDFDSKRTFYKQIEELPTEESRASLLAPVTGRYYFVMDPPVLWKYTENGWVQITTPPEDLRVVEEYVDILRNRVNGSVDEDGNFIVMFDESFFIQE